MTPGRLSDPERWFPHGPPPRRSFFRRRGRTFQELARGPPPPAKKTPVRASRRALAARAVAREVTGSERRSCGCGAWRAPCSEADNARRLALSLAGAGRAVSRGAGTARPAGGGVVVSPGQGWSGGCGKASPDRAAVGNAGRDFPRSGNQAARIRCLNPKTSPSFCEPLSPLPMKKKKKKPPRGPRDRLSVFGRTVPSVATGGRTAGTLEGETEPRTAVHRP
jgi:hypothetical protein